MPPRKWSPTNIPSHSPPHQYTSLCPTPDPFPRHCQTHSNPNPPLLPPVAATCRDERCICQSRRRCSHRLRCTPEFRWCRDGTPMHGSGSPPWRPDAAASRQSIRCCCRDPDRCTDAALGSLPMACHTRSGWIWPPRRDRCVRSVLPREYRRHRYDCKDCRLSVADAIRCWHHSHRHHAAVDSSAWATGWSCASDARPVILPCRRGGCPIVRGIGRGGVLPPRRVRGMPRAIRDGNGA
mmetsp:Transcript_34808/g.73452  ORF Transcript_34808/g.73452 Transcript_34808/m.73452 type:complete len:238 (-) Transcript_34808:1535-2248(-)